MAESSQKFINRNRAPRVHIEYDVETYGSSKKVQLPFVMGVMADLSGNAGEPDKAIDERPFREFDVDNFEERMRAIRPRVQFNVPNALTGEGNMAVDIAFESMDDFSPAAIAKKVESLNTLLQARTQLANLLTYMDGKSGAEKLIQDALQNPTLLQALASTPKGAEPDAPKE
jgi:type VI secretion system protein ImpB